MINKPSLFTLAFLPAVAFALTASAADTVTALKVPTLPDLQAGAADPTWAKAQALSVPLAGGTNLKDGKTTATIRRFMPGTCSTCWCSTTTRPNGASRSPYQKQPDGSWKKVSDPDDKGGDNNKFYEDKFALIWNIDNSIKGFSQMGCMAACHMGEPGKPYGNKYTASKGELGDIWHMKLIRTGYIGQVDDQYLDHTRYDKDKALEAGRKATRSTGGGYTDIKLVNGKPEFMHKNGTPANKGGTYYLEGGGQSPFDDSKFKPGDEVASIVVAPFTGDRGDIAATIKWNNGKWTAVISRKLVTSSKTDVQFDNLDGDYEFGFAAFDNAQVRHAFHVGALKLKFAK